MLSEKQQRWILKRLLDGQEPQIDPEEITAYRTEYDLVKPLPVPERKFALLSHYNSIYSNGQDLFNCISNCTPPDGAQYKSYADLDGTFPLINFLWQWWIPNGYITTLAARGGTGKSLLALDWAKRVIQGDSSPDGSPMCARSKNVIFVEAENVPQINLERAKRWDIDLTNLYPLLPPPYGAIDLNQPEYKDQLIEMINHLNPGLVVIDSLGSSTSKGINAMEDIQPIILFLSALANDANCAIILIHHSRKRANNTLPGMPMTLDDVIGSSYITNGSRVVIGLDIIQTGPKLDKNGPRRLQVLKSNFDHYPDPLGCHLVRQSDGTSRIEYGESPAVYKETTKVDDCAEWIIDRMFEIGEPIKPKDLFAEANAEGFSRATFYRAKAQLGDTIISTGGPSDPTNLWELAPE